MIALLRGTLLEKALDEVIVDVEGVGYRVSVSQTTLGQLPKEGETVRLRTHTHVREDALALFGFSTAEEEALFHLLTTVSGVGPRLALAILSGMPPRELAHAIAHNEWARLTKISGVGKKTAERLVVELADKIRASPLLLVPGLRSAPAATPSRTPPDELVSALVNLGFRPTDAERVSAVVREGHPNAPLEQLVPLALQQLSSRSA